MNEPVKETPSWGKVLDTAFEVARNYKEYQEYGSEAKACKALQRRCKGLDAVQAADALRKGIQLLEVAVEMVKKDNDKLWQSWNASSKQDLVGLDYSDFEDEIKRRSPGFDLATYRKALGWVFMWYYLK
jgi:hypothetical protein